MKLENLTCNNCGSHSLIKISEFEYQCEHCGLTNYLEGASKELIEINSLILHAYETLKREDFTTADEMFSEILLKHPNNYEALWGSLASRYGIVFVNENGNIFPTFHDILDVSFINGNRFQDFIKKVPDNKRNVYLKLANEIESIRNKYFELVKKEEPYDIFISFKASDENGNDTKDLEEATKLFGALANKGYRVFFSPVSLKGKSGSEYEPYIYHALRTSKIMILYGQKIEYIESKWVKNEWGRFLKMIDEKEKLEGSLLVCYENMKAHDLPRRFQKLQCIDFSSKDGYMTLFDNIKSIYDKLSKKATLEEIDIKKKVSVKKKDSVTTKKVELYKFNNVENNDDLTDAKMEVINDLIQNKDFYKSISKLNDFLTKNPNSIKARFALLLCEKKLTYDEFYSNIQNVNSLLNDIKELIPLCNKNTALELFINPVVNTILSGSYETFEKDINSVTNVITFLINYKFKQYNEIVDFGLECAINSCNLNLFNILINLVDANDVDSHIDLRIEMAVSLYNNKRYSESRKLIDEVLGIDEGNSHSLYLKLLCKIGVKPIIKTIDDVIWKELDNAISYEKDNNGIIIDFANRVINEGIYDEKFFDVFINIIKRIISNKELRGEYAMKAGNKLLEKEEYNLARNFFEIYISESEKAKEYGYLKLLYCEYNSKDENDLFNQSENFINSSNYMNALAYSKKDNNDKLYNAIITYDEKWKIKQEENLKIQKQKELEEEKRKIKLEKEKIKKELEEEKRKIELEEEERRRKWRIEEDKKRRKKRFYVSAFLLLILFVVPTCLILIFFKDIYSVFDKNLSGAVLYIFIVLLLITNLQIFFSYALDYSRNFLKVPYLILIISIKILVYYTMLFGIILLKKMLHLQDFIYYLLIIPSGGFTIISLFIDKEINKYFHIHNNFLQIFENIIFILFILLAICYDDNLYDDIRFMTTYGAIMLLIAVLIRIICTKKGSVKKSKKHS